MPKISESGFIDPVINPVGPLVDPETEQEVGTFIAYRRGNRKDPYQRPLYPDHVHKPNGCTDQRYCPDDHWIGGRPEAEYPHHVEVDTTTGAVAYTRLAPDEVTDLTYLSDFLAEQEVAAVAVEDARITQLKVRAAADPDFKALAELLGVDLSTTLKGVKKTK